MDPIVVDIPGVGPVEFPATMSQTEIDAAAKRLFDASNKEPVVEKESPELMGYLGGAAGAVGAAGDVIYSKGRPLIRMAEKAMGMPTEAAPKPRTFLDPSQVAQQAIERRTVAPGAPGSAVENWAKTQHTGEFLGGAEYGAADKIKKEALEFEAKNPTQRVLPGSLLAVPEEEAKRLAGQRAELAAAKDVQNQAEVQKVAQERAQRLNQQGALKQNLARKNVLTGTANIAGKVGLPILGGYELGSQGAQAYNRLTRPDMTAGDVAAGAANVAGAGAGAASMLPGKYRIPAAIIAQGAGAIANWLDKRNPRTEDVEQKAAGGAIGALSKLKKLNLADLEGKTLLGTMSDRTKVGGGLKGGPMFPTVHEGAAWAMDAPGAATRLLKAMHGAGGPEKTVVAPMLMSPGAQRSNRDVSKMAVGQFQKNFQEGGFSPERLAEIEARIRSMPGLLEHPGMMDEGAQELMNNLTFAQRKQIVDALASKPKTAQALDLQKLLRETTEPGLQEAPLGAIGPSVFKLSGERSVNPELHGSYSHILHGEPVGAIDPIPREFLFRDLESKAMKELGRPLSDYNYRTSVGTPSQLIDEKLLRALEELGYLK